MIEDLRLEEILDSIDATDKIREFVDLHLSEIGVDFEEERKTPNPQDTSTLEHSHEKMEWFKRYQNFMRKEIEVVLEENEYNEVDFFKNLQNYSGHENLLILGCMFNFEMFCKFVQAELETIQIAEIECKGMF